MWLYVSIVSATIYIYIYSILKKYTYNFENKIQFGQGR